MTQLEHRAIAKAVTLGMSSSMGWSKILRPTPVFSVTTKLNKPCLRLLMEEFFLILARGIKIRNSLEIRKSGRLW